MKGNVKKIMALFLVMVVVAFALMACGSSYKVAGTKESDESAASSSADTTPEVQDVSPQLGSKVYEGNELLSGVHHAEIDIKDYGTIAVELDADTAPQSVSNFVALAKSGFYDGLGFHRIIDGFMMQGGDPEGTGMGGSDDTITGEFAENGIENNISHVRGVISMARSLTYNSASSQFFIVHEDSTFLDGQYAGFGTVTSGMEIVDDICKNVPVQDDNGTVLEADRPIISTIRILD